MRSYFFHSFFTGSFILRLSIKMHWLFCQWRRSLWGFLTLHRVRIFSLLVCLDRLGQTASIVKSSWILELFTINLSRPFSIDRKKWSYAQPNADISQKPWNRKSRLHLSRQFSRKMFKDRISHSKISFGISKSIGFTLCGIADDRLHLFLVFV